MIQYLSENIGSIWVLWLVISLVLLVLSLLASLGDSKTTTVEDTKVPIRPVQESPTIELNEPWGAGKSRMEMLDDLGNAKDELDQDVIKLQQEKAISEAKMLQNQVDAMKSKQEAETAKQDYMRRKLESDL